MTHWVAVAIGGAVGAVARYGLSLGVARWWGVGFPWGTLIANALGCLLLGALAEWALHSEALDAWHQKALGVGFLGAFTTFSTFAHDTMRLLEKGRMSDAVLNLSLNLAIGLIAVTAGIWLVRRVC